MLMLRERHTITWAHFVCGESLYRFSFNGKENDNEVKGTGNQQDYGMRIYDPRMGRFFSVDPLFRDFAWNSTYSFAENDIIRNIDLDGMEKFPVYNKSIQNKFPSTLKVTNSKTIESERDVNRKSIKYAKLYELYSKGEKTDLEINKLEERTTDLEKEVEAIEKENKIHQNELNGGSMGGDPRHGQRVSKAIIIAQNENKKEELLDEMKAIENEKKKLENDKKELEKQIKIENGEIKKNKEEVKN